MAALTLDIEAYKQRFRALKQETTYQRVNRVASRQTAQAWATCTPLTKDQLWDDFGSAEYTTMLTNINVHQTARRSTMAGGLYGQVYALARVTERLAILHSLGIFRFEAEDPTTRENELPPKRWCIIGKHWKPVTAFIFRPRWLHSWSYACTDCKMQQTARVWHKWAA